MLKFATNIMFILIIFVLATSLPLSTDILTLNLSQPIIENPDESPVVVVSDITIKSSSDYMITDGNLSFSLISSTEQFPKDLLSHFTLNLIGNKSQGSTLPLDQVAQLSPNSVGTAREYTVDLSSVLESLPKDYYIVQIAPDKDYAPTQNSESLEHMVSTYDFGFIYNGTSNVLPSGVIGMTLYYPTPDYEMLVPVTRVVPTPDNRWRSLYTQLAGGSKPGLGLIEGEQVIPHSPNIRISNGIANVYLYSQSLTGFEDKFSVITESIAQSMLSLGFISDVNFLVNDSDTGSFGDVDLSKSYANGNSVIGYVGYNSDSEYAFLMPLTKMVGPDVQLPDRINEIWNILKFNDSEITYSEEWIQLVPPQVEMIDFNLEGDLLTLNLNEVFNTITTTESVESKMLIDSLIYSFTSITEVNRIKITVDGNTPTNPELATELVPPPYINMEP